MSSLIRMNFHTEECPLANKKDVLGLLEEEPIYAEDRITRHTSALKGYIPALKGHAPVS
jgi:hypothetical protein